MPPSPTRLAAKAVALAAAIAVLGFAWEFLRFGLTAQAAAARVEREVRGLVADRTRHVTALASSVAREHALVTAAAASRDELPALFNRLLQIARPAGPAGPSATIYVPAGPAGTYRVLAWSDGPAEDLHADRLSGPRALFLAPGTVGLRLIALQPIEISGRRVGVASAELVLSPARAGSVDAGHTLETSLGAVEISQFTGAGDDASAHRFVIATDAGNLLEVRISGERLAAQRRTHRARVLAASALPLIVLPALAIGPLLDRRRRAGTFARWAGWSAAAMVLLALTAMALIALARSVGAPAGVSSAVVAIAAAATAALVPVSAWWRRWPRRTPGDHPVRFAAEHLAAGLAVAAAIAAVAALLRRGITPATLGRWQLPLMPMDAGALLDLGTVLVLQIAIGWSIASMLVMLVVRWHLHWRRGVALVAALLWISPAVVGALFVWSSDPAWRALIVAGSPAGAAAVIFALLGAPLRRYYRHTSQAMRLLLLFAALVLPPIALYPMAAASADQTARRLIEEIYAPATAQHPDRLIEEIARVERQINRIPQLEELIAAGSPVNGGISSQLAFQIWSRTSLADKRLTSEIEVYGADRKIVSRFALNMPEFGTVGEATTLPWQGTGCAWEDWSEVTRLGAEERSMLHSERGVCDERGQIIGAIVVHILPDYRDLPFVTSASPYYGVVGGGEVEPELGASRIPDLEVVVYGWSLGPVFTSGRIAWPIPDPLFARLYASRDSFWTTLPVDSRTYHVYFMNNRAGVYAVGYAPPAVFQHLTRLSEVVVVGAVVFVLLLVASTLAAPLFRRPDAPLGVLFHEIRTSFYRKLFLFFVLAAVGPVILFALAFGAYMTSKFRADIQGEAASVVTVARRVLEELAAVGQHPDQRQPPPPDDVMVWIRQVVGQDVNLFDGPHLVATSQRDLFDSGLLPARTPAAVYREIALNRLPVFVDVDELGSFRYLVAAAPVRTFGRDAVLTVPLATRQREIDAQSDELNRGVLVGAVVVVLFAAGLGASVAGRVSDPVARLTRATRLIAAGRLDVRVVADTADELGRLVDDFNSMAQTLVANRDELARSHQLKAWAEMARQVAHEIKNPLTPIQLAAEHLQRVHEDRGRPLGAVFDQCLTTVLGQVRLLRRIASEFSTFAGQPTARPVRTAVADLVTAVVDPYRLGASNRIAIEVDLPSDLPAVFVDRTLVSRALTNLVENAVQAMASGGDLRISARDLGDAVEIVVADTGVGMDEEAVRRAFEPYFSTKTAGSGLGLANARRNIELSGGTISIASAPSAGTTVTVTLPVASRRGAPESATPPVR